MPTPLTSYRWASGSSVALNSLSFVENDLYPFNKLHRIGIRSPGVEEYPVRDMSQAGYERGDGRIDTYWEIVCRVEALEYIIETKFSLTSTSYVAITLNTRRFHRNDYARYNAYLNRPQLGRDYTYLRQGVVRLRLPFSGLVAL